MVVAREPAPHRSDAAPTWRAAGRLASSARAKARPPLGINTAHARLHARLRDWERRVGCGCFGCRAEARAPSQRCSAHGARGGALSELRARKGEAAAGTKYRPRQATCAVVRLEAARGV